MGKWEWGKRRRQGEGWGTYCAWPQLNVESIAIEIFAITLTAAKIV